jgi:hypothetical protein
VSRERSPALLEVVPWSRGDAHTWALKWLIGEDATRDRVMAFLDPAGAPPWRLTDELRTEYKLPGTRADLAVHAVDAGGREVKIAVETKVNDRINAAQLERYRDARYASVVFAPGLSGVLYRDNPEIAGERWLSGRDLVEAVAGVELPWIIRSYIEAVATEAQRMDQARAFSRGELDDFPHDGRAPYKDVMDTAWLVEIVAAMQRAGAENLLVRTERNDRGVFWEDSWTELPGSDDGAGLLIDVVASLYSDAYAITVKVSDGDEAGRLRCYEAARDAGRPSREGWRLSRPPRRKSGRVWSLDAGEMDAEETASHTLDAGTFLERLGG